MEILYCESCGMFLKEEIDFGTNKDGSKNREYCVYCYKDGAFTSDVTMDEMMQISLNHMNEMNKTLEEKIDVQQAHEMMKQFFPNLKRWKKL